jgi:hypothetical protein
LLTTTVLVACMNCVPPVRRGPSRSCMRRRREANAGAAADHAELTN